MEEEIHLVDSGHDVKESFHTPSLHTPNPRVPEIPASSLPPSTVVIPVLRCETRIDLHYDITPAVICALCAVFGVLYCFLGE